MVLGRRRKMRKVDDVLGTAYEVTEYGVIALYLPSTTSS